MQRLDGGWGYCSTIQKVTKQKKPTRNQTLLALLLLEPSWALSVTFSLLVTFQAS